MWLFKGLSLCFALLFVQIIVCDKNSGVNIGFRNKFFNQLSLDIVHSMVNVLSHVKIVNYTSKSDLGIVNFTLHLDYANVSKIQIEEASGLSLNNGIIFNIKNFSIEFETKLQFYTTPLLFFGNGTVHLKIDQTGNDIELQISTDDKQNIRINFTKLEFTISEQQVSFESAGSNDIFLATQLGFNWAIPIVINALRNPIQESVRDSISNTLNSVIKSMNRTLNIISENIFMDISLLDNCQVVNDRFMLYLNGTVFSTKTNGKKVIKYEPPNNIPEMDPNGKSMQVILSNYTLNTLFQAMYLDNLLIFNISKPLNPKSKFNMDTTFLSVFIPQIIDAYGYKKPIEIIIQVTEAPNTFFSNKKFELNLKTNISIFVNTTTQKEIALKVVSDIYFPLNIYLRKGVLYGNTTSYTFSTKLLEHSQILNINNITNIDLLINTILQMILPQLNSILTYGKGFNMTQYGLDFTDTIFNINDNYIEIDSTPIIPKQKIEDSIVESLVEFKKGLSKRLRKDINLLLDDKPLI